MTPKQRQRLQSLLRNSGDPNHHHGQQVFPPANGTILSPLSGGIMRHVANILSGPRSNNPSKEDGSSPGLKHKPIYHVANGVIKSSPVSSYASSLNDIHRPGGLGHITSLDSNHSSPASVPAEHALHNTDACALAASSTDLSCAEVHLPVPPMKYHLGLLPQELLNMVLMYVPRSLVPHIAITSRAFCEAARVVLYRTIDIRFIRSTRFEALSTLLASHPNVASYVQNLIYHTWHATFFDRSGGNAARVRDTRISLSAPSTTTFMNALKNMKNLQYVTLPSFNFFLQCVSFPLLQGATFLSHTLSSEEQVELKIWLGSQPRLTLLSFPTLFERTGSTFTDANPDIHSSNLTLTTSPSSTPSLRPCPSPNATFSSSRQPSPPPTPSFVPTPDNPVLPSLAVLNATPNLVLSLLTPSQPSPALSSPPPSSLNLSVEFPGSPQTSSFPVPPSQQLSVLPLLQATLRVHTTIYTGLRPSALMHALASRGTKKLTLRFTDDADRRTIEKMLSAAGSILCSRKGIQKDNPLLGESTGHPALLEVLEVEIGRHGIWQDDETLYKVVNSVLSRYQTLHGLHLRYAASAISLPTFKGDSLPLSTRSLPASPIRPSHSRGSPSFQDQDYLFLSGFGLSESEQMYVSMWVRQCPSLRVVTLLSGSEWGAEGED